MVTRGVGEIILGDKWNPWDQCSVVTIGMGTVVPRANWSGSSSPGRQLEWEQLSRVTIFSGSSSPG